MKRKDSNKKKMIALVATPEEVGKIERLMQAKSRNSYGDLIRVLVNEEYEKIFA